jgi:hypothetical protein
MLIFVPGAGALETDLVLARVTDAPSLRRTDDPIIQLSPVAQAIEDDPNATPSSTDIPDVPYRLGSTANYDGAITYLFWTILQGDAGKAGVRVAAIDGGNGCVEPTTETIQDGSYPLAFTNTLVFSRSALGDEVVGALLWHALSAAALDQVAELSLVGFDRTALEQERESIFAMIEEAQKAAQEAATDGEGEATATPEADGTPEATPEASEGDATPTETPSE